MVRQMLKLDIGWTVYVYYAVTPSNVWEVMCALWQIGCRGKDLIDAYRNISSGILNNGLTFSNPLRNGSVMVIGMASSQAEFQNTVVHEIGHISTHISQHLSIDQYGEEKQYLAGEIGQKMFPVTQKFICGCKI